MCMTKPIRIALIAGGTIVALGVIAFGARIFASRPLSSAAISYDDAKSVPFAGSQGIVQRDMMAEESILAPSVMPEPPMGGGGATEIPAADRLIVKTAVLSMAVETVEGAVTRIAAYALQNGGFVVSSNISVEDISPRGMIVIRIPSDIFDAGMSALKGMGEVKSEQMNGQDVTEEYVDLDAQLRNLRAAETQFLAIMRQAVKITDILEVQRQLTEVRDRIERIEGRMKYLRQSAAMSTITVYLTTDPKVLPVVDEREPWKPFAVVKDAVRNLIDIGKALVEVLIWLVVYIPLWLLIGLLGWGVYRLIRRMLRKKVSM